MNPFEQRDPSVARRGVHVEVILDGTSAASDFLVAYERDLGSHGWRRFEQLHHRPGGFDAGWHMGPAAILVNETAVSALFIAARQVENGRTEVGLRYDRENAANMTSATGTNGLLRKDIPMSNCANLDVWS